MQFAPLLYDDDVDLPTYRIYLILKSNRFHIPSSVLEYDGELHAKGSCVHRMKYLEPSICIRASILIETHEL